ncbi:MAG: hypothetical protein AAFV45_06475 [Pseudomonadota bacterium]
MPVPGSPLAPNPGDNAADMRDAASVRNMFSGSTGYPSFPAPNQKTLERRSSPDSRVSDVDGLKRDTEKTDLESVKVEIADALAAKDQAALGHLYLTQGVLLKQAGQSAVAGDVLRKCVMIAMQLKDARLHAMGRLELGDVVAEAGDLTTACEHWQMAKAMFLEVRHRADSEAADARMLKSGCPTEWVLTEF